MSSVAPPKIPYIGTSLADLTFIEDGNPDHLDGMINFTKRYLLFGNASTLVRVIECNLTEWLFRQW